MKIHKNVIIASALTMLLALPLVGMAVVLPGQPTIPTGLGLGDTVPTALGGTDAVLGGGLINRILTVVWYVFVGIVVVFFIIIAVLFLSSQGNPEAIATARKALVWGAAGVIVGVLAFGIIGILTRTLGIPI